jgi:hypothetical protein
MTRLCVPPRPAGNVNERQPRHVFHGRIVKRAGLTPWPKLFVNLRATRATELSEQYPGHVVAAWLGHSEAIGQEHYLRTTDEHFSRAALALQFDAVSPPCAVAPQDDAKSASRANDENPGTEADGAAWCDYDQNSAMVAGGLEPTTPSV